jgi:hypothetical protein
MALGSDGALELGHLLGFGGDCQLPPLGIGGFGAQRAATEQPDRPTGQDGAVSLDERSGFLLPVRGVDGASDDERVVAGQVVYVLHGSRFYFLSGLPQLGGDPLGYPLGGAVFAGVDDECRHGPPPAFIVHPGRLTRPVPKGHFTVGVASSRTTGSTTSRVRQDVRLWRGLLCGRRV